MPTYISEVLSPPYNNLLLPISATSLTVNTSDWTIPHISASLQANGPLNMCKKIALVRYKACGHQRIPDDGTYAMVRYELCSDANGHFASCHCDITWDIERQENQQEFLACELCLASQRKQTPASAPTQDPKSLGNSVDRLVNPVIHLSLEAIGDKRKRATDVQVQPPKRRCHSPTPSVDDDASSTSGTTLVDPEDLEEREKLATDLKDTLDRVEARRHGVLESLLTAPVLASPPPSPVSVPAQHSLGTPKAQEETPEAGPRRYGGPEVSLVPVAQGKGISGAGGSKKTSGPVGVPQGTCLGLNNDDEPIPDENSNPGSAAAAPQSAEDCTRACTRCRGSGYEP